MRFLDQGDTVDRLFGTDGVRGLANQDLTAELALDLSVAAAHVVGEAGVFAGRRPVAVVGRDTRASGEFLEAAVVAGLASAGVDVLRAGVLPTPAIAYLTDSLGADLGVVLSASHNPMPDNGIKFFAKGGTKLDDSVEDAIEARLREPWQRPIGAAVGRVRDYAEGFTQYVSHIVDATPHRLDGLRVVIDCANGAALPGRPGGAATAGRRRRHGIRRPRWAQHQRRLRVDPPRPVAESRRQPSRRCGHCPRR